MEEKLTLNDFAIEALRSSAKWSMFLAIVGFIFIGLMILLGGIMSVAMSAMTDDVYGGAEMSINPIMAFKAYFGIAYIIIALLNIMPVYYLFNYAKGIKKTLESGSSEMLSDALVNLKSHHKFLGILTIVTICLYILSFIGAIIFAATMASHL